MYNFKMYKQEIERRFLIRKKDSKKIIMRNIKKIMQGYYDLKKLKRFDPIKKVIENYHLSENEFVRIRIEDKDQIYLTIKKGDGIKRKEFETKLDFDREIYNHLKTDKKILKKIRGEFNLNGYKAVLDKFTKRYQGLEIVELEFKNKNEAKKFLAPSDYIEITDISELTNKNLYLTDHKKIFRKVEELYGNKNKK